MLPTAAFRKSSRLLYFYVLIHDEYASYYSTFSFYLVESFSRIIICFPRMIYFAPYQGSGGDKFHPSVFSGVISRMGRTEYSPQSMIILILPKLCLFGSSGRNFRMRWACGRYLPPFWISQLSRRQRCVRRHISHLPRAATGLGFPFSTPLRRCLIISCRWRRMCSSISFPIVILGLFGRLVQFFFIFRN